MTDATTGFLARAMKAFLPRLGDAIARFPLAIVFAAVLTVFLIFVAEDFRGWQKDFDFIMRVSGALACGALWGVSAVLFAEAQSKSNGFGNALGALGTLIIALLFWFHHQADLVEYALGTALVLLVGLMPYLFRPKDNRAFWEFNHDVWIGAAFALLAGVLLAAGASAILATLEYLFKIDVRNELWAEVWIVANSFVAPLYWLNTIPKRFDVQVVEGDQKDAELTTRMITVLVKFILVPLLLIYTGILYAYAVKIGIGWELPKGRLGYMVTAFGGAGILTALMAFPSRNSSGPLVRFFWRHWFWLTAVPLVLLFIAIYRRVSEYGITHERYLLIIIGLWLLGVVLLFGLRLANRDLRIVPGLLAALLAVTSVGPWSIEALPARMLASELTSLLAAEGSLDDKGMLKPVASLPAKRDKESTARMHSIVRYLVFQNQSRRLEPILGGDADTLISRSGAKRRASRWKDATAIQKRLLLPANNAVYSKRQYFNLASRAPGDIRLQGASSILGPISMHRRNNDKTLNSTFGGKSAYSATVEEGVLRLSRENRPFGSFDVRVIAEMARGKLDHKKENGLPLRLPAASGGRPDAMIVSNVSGRREDNSVRINALTFWLLMPPVVSE